MPTLPKEPAGSGQPHHARQIAESFGAVAEQYERTRPTYPKEMVEAILAATDGRDVLDVGIGTGISARPFRDRGCRVLGVEPDEQMADYARRGGFDVAVAKFEVWDPANRTFDLVIAGQSWHWVDPAVGARKAAVVLRPGGRIALFWNVMDFPDDIAPAIADAYQTVLPEFPFFQNGLPGGTASYAPLLDNASAGLREAILFSEPERWEFQWEHSYTRDEWLEQVPTFGGHGQIPASKLTALLAAIGKAVDQIGGTLRLGYTATVVTATRQK